jgi:hypothetical protein
MIRIIWISRVLEMHISRVLIADGYPDCTCANQGGDCSTYGMPRARARKRFIYSIDGLIVLVAFKKHPFSPVMRIICRSETPAYCIFTVPHLRNIHHPACFDTLQEALPKPVLPLFRRHVLRIVKTQSILFMTPVTVICSVCCLELVS